MPKRPRVNVPACTHCGGEMAYRQPYQDNLPGSFALALWQCELCLCYWNFDPKWVALERCKDALDASPALR